MIAIHAHTPYHLFNAINIRCNMYRERDDIDLYLTSPDTGGIRDFCENVEKSGLFKNVYIVEDLWYKRNRITKALKIRGSVLSYWEFRKAKRQYEVIWTPEQQFELYMILHFSRKYNPNTQYLGFEEGEGSYSHGSIGFLGEERIRFLKKMHIEVPERADIMLLYHPELANETVVEPVGQLPEIKWDVIGDVYKKVYGVKDNQFNFEAVLFGSGYKDQTPTFKLIDFFKENEVDVTVKPHPRRVEPFIDNNIKIMQCGTVPWEIVCGITDNIENKLIIGAYSTALFTAKLIFDKEPYIILLDELNNGEFLGWIDEQRIKLKNKIISMYLDQSKVMIPKTMDELLSCIELWKSAR